MEILYLEQIAEQMAERERAGDYMQIVGFQNAMNTMLRDAALNGELICYNGFGKYQPKEYEGSISTTGKAVNDWLQKIESPYRYRVKRKAATH